MKKLGITQELLSLVTGLAHYLKILIRLALTSALRLVKNEQPKNCYNINSTFWLLIGNHCW